MAQGYPEQNTPRTILTFEIAETVNSTARSDSSYLNTWSFLLKVMQMGFSLLGLTCLVVSGFDFADFDIPFGVMAIHEFVFTGGSLLSYLDGMDKKYPDFPWLKTEFILCWILALCNCLALGTAAFFFSGDRYLTVIASSSLGAMVVYGVDAGLKYREYRLENLARSGHSRANRSLSSLRGSYDPFIEERY